MDVRMLLVPDSTARLVLEELERGAALTQRQFVTRTGRTKGSVSKAIKLLIDEGYVRQTGTRANYLGRLNGKPQQEYSRTARPLLPEAAERDPGASAARDLGAVIDALVRSALAARCGQSVSA